MPHTMLTCPNPPHASVTYQCLLAHQAGTPCWRALVPQQLQRPPPPRGPCRQRARACRSTSNRARQLNWRWRPQPCCPPLGVGLVEISLPRGLPLGLPCGQLDGLFLNSTSLAAHRDGESLWFLLSQAVRPPEYCLKTVDQHAVFLAAGLQQQR